MRIIPAHMLTMIVNREEKGKFMSPACYFFIERLHVTSFPGVLISRRTAGDGVLQNARYCRKRARVGLSIDGDLFLLHVSDIAVKFPVKKLFRGNLTFYATYCTYYFINHDPPTATRMQEQNKVTTDDHHC